MNNVSLSVPEINILSCFLTAAYFGAGVFALGVIWWLISKFVLRRSTNAAISGLVLGAVITAAGGLALFGWNMHTSQQQLNKNIVSWSNHRYGLVISEGQAEALSKGVLWYTIFGANKNEYVMGDATRFGIIHVYSKSANDTITIQLVYYKGMYRITLSGNQDLQEIN